jgi:nicotinate dehydrogenase subunit B
MTELTAQPRKFDRRKFVVGSGALVVAIGTPRLLNPKAAFAQATELPIGPALVDPLQVDSWLAIKGDGTVILQSGKEELGTGTVTTAMQVVADELDVSFDKIRSVIADTWTTPNQGVTAGSQSSPTNFTTANGVRQAAAEARAALLGLAATALGQPVSNLTVKDGVITPKNGGAQTTYAALVGNKKINAPITGKAVPKSFFDYKVVGTSVPRVDIPEKVFGKFTFNGDIRLPGMAFVRVVRPPTYDSTLVAIDGFPHKIPGLIKVVVKKNWVAVVAEREEQAAQAASSLKVRWSVAPLPNFSTFHQDLVNTPAANMTNRVLINTFDTDAKLAGAAKTVTAEYRYPIQMHGPMGASSAAAWVQGNTAVLWTHTQNVWAERTMVSQATGIPAQNIRVIFVEGSGVYGLSGADNAGLDAIMASQATGRPVRVQYTRSDDHKWENYGQPYVHKIKGGLDASGKIVAWDSESWTTSRGGRPGPPASTPSGVLMGFPENPLAASPAPTPSQAPYTVDGSNNAPSYITGAERIVTHTAKLSFFHGPLRSPNRIQNTWAYEQFVDELAHAAGKDPLAFRVAHLKDQRLIDVFNLAAKQANWQPKVANSKPGSDRILKGRGIAGMIYEGDNGYNAAVADITVDTKTGKIAVTAVYSGQDCGPVLNPRGMAMQAEGCAMQAISRTLKEELKWGPNGVTSKDWETYPVIRFNEMPSTFKFQAIDRKDADKAMGAGEVLITSLPPAIANAFFDATGARIRDMPLTPAKVRAALKAVGKA